MEFEQPFEESAVGLKFSVGDVNKVTQSALFVDFTDAYYLHTVAQLTYSRQFFLGGVCSPLLSRAGLAITRSHLRFRAWPGVPGCPRLKRRILPVRFCAPNIHTMVVFDMAWLSNTMPPFCTPKHGSS